MRRVGDISGDACTGGFRVFFLLRVRVFVGLIFTLSERRKVVVRAREAGMPRVFD